ncbi:MAG TPA: hypothetical protein VK203_10770 [Nostocaceae cyanobacterium]|nr:hypothetical protein [Nostocaceae cyanobacterium]
MSDNTFTTTTSADSGITISFTSKLNRDKELKRKELIEAGRIIAYEQHKAENPDRPRGEGLAFYKEWEAEWNQHPIHKQSYEDIIAMFSELGYTESDLMNVVKAHKDYKSRSSSGKSYPNPDFNAQLVAEINSGAYGTTFGSDDGYPPY